MAYFKARVGGNKNATSFRLFTQYLPCGAEHGYPKGQRLNMFQYTCKKNVNIKITSVEGAAVSSLPYARYEVYCNGVLLAYTPYQNSPVDIDVTTSSSDSDKTIVISVYNNSLNSGIMPPIDVTISET